MSSKPTIVWFRQDLRVADHPALTAAQARGGPIIPVYIWAPEEEGTWAPGAASRWWLHHSLKALTEELASYNLRLIIRRGSSLQQLQKIAQESEADAVFWQRRYEPASIKRDTQVKKTLKEQGLNAASFNGTLLIEPWELLNKQHTPFKVFTPFWRACQSNLRLQAPLPPLVPCQNPSPKLDSLTVSSLALLAEKPWEQGLKASWNPGCKHAFKALEHALDDVVVNYAQTRDRPDLDGVSKLSPYLHFGELSPRQIWHAVQARLSPQNLAEHPFLRQLGWREFAHYLLYHFPHTPTEPFQEKFAAFTWKSDTHALKTWQRGQTGFPLVDAGMRQLWKTGWMHNRVRMVVASFLVKDLMLPWLLGAQWFWDTLVDADLANNTLGWQWAAGCGADAAPFFRIFNPTTQGEKFDESKSYVRTWVPELSQLSDKWIYKPWLAPEAELQRAGVVLGRDYPKPIVEHDKARLEALAYWKELS